MIILERILIIIRIIIKIILCTIFVLMAFLYLIRFILWSNKTDEDVSISTIILKAIIPFLISSILFFFYSYNYISFFIP